MFGVPWFTCKLCKWCIDSHSAAETACAVGLVSLLQRQKLVTIILYNNINNAPLDSTVAVACFSGRGREARCGRGSPGMLCSARPGFVWLCDCPWCAGLPGQTLQAWKLNRWELRKEGSTSLKQCGGAEAFWFLPCWLSCNHSTLLSINSVPFGFNFRSNAVTQGNPLINYPNTIPDFTWKWGVKTIPITGALSHCQLDEFHKWQRSTIGGIPCIFIDFVAALQLCGGKRVCMFCIVLFAMDSMDTFYHFPGFGLFYSFMF